MNPFIREHAGPLIGSATLHLVIAAGAIAAAFLTIAPHVTPPAAIEAYIAKPTAKPAPPPPAPAPEPTPAVEPAPQPDPRIAEREAAEKAATERIIAEHAAAEHAEQVRIAEAKREAQAQAQRRAAEAEEAKRQAKQRAAAQEAQKRADEAKRKADAAAEAQKRADAADRAAREADLARDLAADEHREGVAKAGLPQYIALIQARIERAWKRPPTAHAGLKCIVIVSQVPGGTVTNVRLGACNGDGAVQESITNAVYNASPLPMPSDPSLFERTLQLVFQPDDR